jgi:dTDP-glucose 4,6-dehydratase
MPLPLYGNGSNIRDWLHVDDHCRGIHKILTKGLPGEIYNVGGGTELSNLDITRKILNLMSADDSKIRFTEDRLGHDLRYSVKIDKISQKLDYVPIVKFEEGLRRTVDWYVENESWWRPLKVN